MLYTYQARKTLFGPIKPTNPSLRFAYEGQSSFGIIAMLYTYQARKTLFGPIKPINTRLWLAYKHDKEVRAVLE